MPGTKRQDLVVYNRVPKSGSSSWQLSIDRLGKMLGFKTVHHSVPPFIPCDNPSFCMDTSEPVPFKSYNRFLDEVLSLPNASGTDVVIDFHWFHVDFPGVNHVCAQEIRVRFAFILEVPMSESPIHQSLQYNLATNFPIYARPGQANYSQLCPRACF